MMMMMTPRDELLAEMDAFAWRCINEALASGRELKDYEKEFVAAHCEIEVTHGRQV